jgi:hypothetical protein
MEYRLVYDWEYPTFRDGVNAAIEDGWTPLPGGFAVRSTDDSPSGVVFYQAVTKEDAS